MNNPTSYLATLPEPVQAELVALVRRAAGLSTDEKVAVLKTLNYIAERFSQNMIFEAQALTVELLSPLSQIIAVLHHSTDNEGA